jgi:hypothetical protein
VAKVFWVVSSEQVSGPVLPADGCARECGEADGWVGYCFAGRSPAFYGIRLRFLSDFDSIPWVVPSV